MLRLQEYDLTFEFTPGKHFIVTDTLHRAGLQHSKSTTEEDVQIQVDYVRAQMRVSKAKWEEIARATQEDETLQSVMKKISLPGEMKLSKPYHHFKWLGGVL